MSKASPQDEIQVSATAENWMLVMWLLTEAIRQNVHMKSEAPAFIVMATAKLGQALDEANV